MSDTAAVRPSRAGDLALVALALGLAVVTALLVTLPALVPAIVNDRLDIGITTASLLVSVAVAALNGARGRVAGDAAAVLRGSAFWVLAAFNLLIFAVQIPGVEASFGASLEAPGQLPVIATIVARGTAAVLLIGAGIVALREPKPLARPGWVLSAPAILVAVAIAAGATVQDQLPAVIDPATLDELARDPTAALRPGAAPWLVTMQATLGVGFLVASVLAHRSWRHNGRIGQLLLSAGLLIAAFSQAHTAIHPGSFVSLVTTGDLLRLAFYIVLLIGFVIDSRDDLRALRRANVQLQRLGEAELAGAALEERARLAREIHDGLAQDLWYAKLKQSRLTQTSDLGGEALALSHEVTDAIDSALAEARNAVAAMREGVEAGSLIEMVSRHVDDFSDRFAIRAEITQSGRPPDVGPRAQAEVLRIVQEALTNVRKHADATVVRVDVATDGELRLMIADNGRGFRTESAPPGFGLESMRQRAELIGARLTVTSEPQNGTRIELHVPLRQREENGDG